MPFGMNLLGSIALFTINVRGFIGLVKIHAPVYFRKKSTLNRCQIAVKSLHWHSNLTINGGRRVAVPSCPGIPTMTSTPLAERLRPQTFDDVIGQQHLLGPGKPLRVAFESGQPHSMILWGPPGVGKTTVAR